MQNFGINTFNLLCQSAALAALEELPIDVCQNIGQIQKLIVQFTNESAGVLNKFIIATADPTLKATWDAAKAEIGSKKVVITPFIGEPENEAGELRRYGGGNATPGGVEIILGTDAAPFTAKFLHKDQAAIKKMKEWNSLDISVFLVNEAGQIIGVSQDSTVAATEFRGIPLYPNTFFVGDKVLGGYEGVDYNPIEFQFPPNWSDDLMVVTPADFSALSEI